MRITYFTYRAFPIGIFRVAAGLRATVAVVLLIMIKRSTKNEAVGKAREVKGHVKKHAGEAMNRPDMEKEGRDEQTAGKVQKKAGQIEKVFGQ
jgi:uncharacterized protein YjbJ (UPF0337 family)